VRVLASPRARLTKDLRVVEAPVSVNAIAPRTARTKPTPGDTVPELRGGNETLPPPMARRRRDGEGRYDRGNSFGAAAGRDRRAAPASSEAGAAAEAAPADRPAARNVFGSDDRGRARRRQPESSAEPTSGARPEAAPAVRSRPLGNDEAGTPRQRGGDAGSPRQEYGTAPRERREYRAEPRERPEYRAEPRERPEHRAEPRERPEYRAEPRERSREGGAERRSAPAQHGGGDGGARARDRAPRQDAAPPSVKVAPSAGEAAAPSARARRQRD